MPISTLQNGIETILYDTLNGIKVIYVFKDFHPLGGYENYVCDEMHGKTQELFIFFFYTS